MNDEDRVAAKLKGFNILVKFVDGEEMLLKVSFVNDPDKAEWFEDVEKFLNGNKDQSFPLSGVAFRRETIKYVDEI